MPDENTAGIGDLKLINTLEGLCKENHSCKIFNTSEIEKEIFNNAKYIEENSFTTGHQQVNIYGKQEQKYEIRSEESAIDIQIHE